MDKIQTTFTEKLVFVFAGRVKPGPCEPEVTNMNVTTVLRAVPIIHGLALPEICGTVDRLHSPTTSLCCVRMQQLMQSLPFTNSELGQ